MENDSLATFFAAEFVVGLWSSFRSFLPALRGRTDTVSPSALGELRAYARFRKRQPMKALQIMNFAAKVTA